MINVKLQTDARILSLHEFAFYISLSETELAFGLASAGSNLKIYQISGDCKTLSLIKTFKLSGAVTDLAYSPYGAYLATADANRKVTLLDQDYEKANSREWGFHTAKVN